MNPDHVRGRLNQIAYGLQYVDIGDQAMAERLADAMIDGRHFAGTVEDLSDAIDTALAQQRLHPQAVEIAEHPEEDLLAFLRRVRAALDRRRPWPPPSRARGAGRSR